MSSARKLLYSIHDPFHPYSPICFLDKSIQPNPDLGVDITTHNTLHHSKWHWSLLHCNINAAYLALNDLFSYKNIVNSNSQYLALQHILFIYRDGTMALARTSGHVLSNPDNVAVFWSKRKQLELRKTLQLYVYLQIHQPMADRKSVRWITSLSELWPLPTMNVHVGIAVLGTDMPKLMKQDLLVSRVSWFVHNQSNCLFTNQVILCKGSSQQVLSVIPYFVLRWEHRSSVLWLVYTGMTLCTLRPSLPWIHRVKLSVYGRLGHLK